MHYYADSRWALAHDLNELYRALYPEHVNNTPDIRRGHLHTETEVKRWVGDVMRETTPTRRDCECNADYDRPRRSAADRDEPYYR